MKKLGHKRWIHRGCVIVKMGGMYVSGWTETARPLMADTLDGIRLLINRQKGGTV